MPFHNWWTKTNQSQSVEGGDEMPEEEIEEVEEEEQEETPTSPMMSAEQVQAMMDRQAETLTKGFQQSLQQLTTPQHEEKEEEIKAPSHAQMKQALEDGDWDAYMKMQEQREAAVYQATQRTLEKGAAALRNEGSQWMTETNKRLLDQQVPDYKKYQKDVDALADQLGINALARTNPEVADLLTSTVRGRPENIEKEIQARIEASKRQANGPGTTSDVSSTGRVPHSGHESNVPVFSNEALQSLVPVGKDKDGFAKMMGYENWAAYEAFTSNLYSEETVVHKWRRPKGVARG